MRYRLVVLLLTVAASAATMLACSSPRRDGTLMVASRVSTAEVSAVPGEPTANSTPLVPVTRERAIEAGANSLNEFGEVNPLLVSARRMTYRQALVSLRHDPAAFIGPEQGISGDRQVWVIVFRGKFSRWSPDPKAQPSVGYFLMDYATGQPIGGGYGGGYDMLTPGPPIKGDRPPKI